MKQPRSYAPPFTPLHKRFTCNLVGDTGKEYVVKIGKLMHTVPKTVCKLHPQREDGTYYIDVKNWFSRKNNME